MPKKSDFLAKKLFFDFFGQNFQKYCLIQEFEKKTFLESKNDFQAILAFLTQNYYF